MEYFNPVHILSQKESCKHHRTVIQITKTLTSITHSTMAAASSLLTSPPATISPLRLHVLSFPSPHLTLKPKTPKTLTLNLSKPVLIPIQAGNSFSSSFEDLSSFENDFEQDPNDQFDYSDEGYKDYDEGRNRSVGGPVDGRLIYVGNLPYTMTASELAEILSEAGEVKSAEIMYDRITGRSRGFAFVKMGSIRDVIAAIKMFNESQIGGRTVEVSMPEVPQGRKRKFTKPTIRVSSQRFVDTPHKLYVGNLPWTLTSEALRDVFARQPGLVSAKIVYEWETGKSRGYGFVTFRSAEDAKAALAAMDGAEVEGRYLKVRMGT
ncbi:RNA-binding protein CP33, chloroplastic-like protein [Drosera capensis]